MCTLLDDIAILFCWVDIVNDLFSFFFQNVLVFRALCLVLFFYINSMGIQKNMFMRRDIEAPPFSVKPQYIRYIYEQIGYGVKIVFNFIR